MIWSVLAMIALQLALRLAFYPVPANAQDIAPETPPELRDFKLEPDKPKPAPQPLPTLNPVIDLPVIKSPPAATRSTPTLAGAKPGVADNSVAATKREPAAVVTKRITPPTAVAAKPKPGAVGGAVLETGSVAASPEAPISAPDAPLPDAAQTGPVVAEPKPQIAEAGQAVPAAASWPWIIAGLAGLFVLALAAWLRRRRNRQPLQQFDADLAAIPDAAPHEPYIETEQSPMPVAAAMPRRHAPAKSTKRPMLDVNFVPAKASISLANLTIKGQLRIVNSGDEDVDAMQLNAAIITASELQNEMISAYFSGAAEPGNELGAVKIGERIALDLDLAIPIAELQTFGFGEQKLLVPIILSRISYQWRNTGSDEAQLSCIIGRESSPPKPKMGALRLDLGPRSFAPLGQRPIFG
jgi:MYXO-CTERM domain-containing protein